MAELRVRTIDESELDTVLAEDFDLKEPSSFPNLSSSRER
jgi:hypothetical protein